MASLHKITTDHIAIRAFQLKAIKECNINIAVGQRRYSSEAYWVISELVNRVSNKVIELTIW